MSKHREITYLVNHATGCWECNSHAPDSSGYPRIQGKERRISRLMYSIHKGEIPSGMVVRHTCDNRLCINPEHLLIGTVQDNIQDAVIRGRLKGLKVKYPTKPVKITGDAEEIEAAIFSGKYSQDSIAEVYGISKGTIWRIKKGVSWGRYLFNKSKNNT